ncbi:MULTISPECIES: hypothetical protein [unclassified Oceanobacillus]|uniref:hypothetical protein n=1 Tax=unclassified Oceanobacillus TaxID=2630292 RepID=UPI00300DCE82
MKKRNLADKWFNPGNKVAFDVVLTESYRNDEGKPRQRYLLHLGTIHEYHAKLPHSLRRFYVELKSRLIDYGVSTDDINYMVARLETKIGAEPSQEESDEYLRKAWKELQDM